MTRRRLLIELDSRELAEWDVFFGLEYELAERQRQEDLLEREAWADLRRK